MPFDHTITLSIPGPGDPLPHDCGHGFQYHASGMLMDAKGNFLHELAAAGIGVPRTIGRTATFTVADPGNLVGCRRVAAATEYVGSNEPIITLLVAAGVTEDQWKKFKQSQAEGDAS